MTRSLTRTLMRLVVIGVVVFCFVFQGVPRSAQAAETAPNTTITNTASATYTDANNVSYTTNSNTVTTTVQNAPSLSIAGTAPQTVSPGEVVTDNFTVTNTGNATGAITLNAPSITGSGTLNNAYVLNGALTGTCSVATPCTLTVLNQQTALTAATVGTAITVGVEYTVATTATPGSQIQTTLTGTITQAAVGNAPAATSPTATATDTDTVKADARLDLYKSVTAPTSPTGNITYTIDGNDGGGFGAKAVVSAGNLLGLTNTAGVIAVLDKLPTVTGTGVTQPALVSAPAVPAVTGATGTVYYSTSTNGESGWSTTFNANATYIALFYTPTAANTTGIIFPADPTGSTGGGVAQGTSQFVFTFQTTQPTGNGVSNPGSLSNIANSIIGGNPGANGTPIIAPGIPPDSDYETSTTTFPATTFGPTAANPPPSTGTTPPGGASNVVTTAAYATQQALNGPLDVPGATGSYNGTAGVSNENDFTIAGFQCANGPATTVVAPTPAVACTWPTTTPVAIPNTVQNTGNGTDNYAIYATAPAGYTVQLFAVTGCPTTVPTVLPIAPYMTGGCTIGAAISPISTSGGSVTTTATTAIPAGGSYNYVAEYAPATGTTPVPFVPVTFDTIAYGTAATVSGTGVPTVGADANETYNVIYPGGPLQVTKSQTIVTNCSGTPAPTSATAVCPGGTITYTLAYKNLAPAALATSGSGIGTEPTFATNAIEVSTAVISDDGTLGSNNWSTTTFGIDANVAPSLNGGTATYTPNVPLSTGTYPAKTQGPTKISVSLPGTIQPGTSGAISFQVTVI